MSTRGSVGVFSNNELFAMYNHCDSYPDGLGREVVDFCQSLSKEQLVLLKERFKSVVKVNEGDVPSDEAKKKYVEEGYYVDGVGNNSPSDWYCLLRNIQGVNFLSAVLDGKCQHCIDSSGFLKDSLFCEYAYILNLDDECLEFYEGFNKAPDKNSPLSFEQVPDKDGYYPVMFKGKVPILEIPDDWMNRFYPQEE